MRRRIRARSTGTLRARFGALAVAASLASAPAAAQCPDGSPPPCRTGAARAPARAASAPLDDRTWIVLPFENTARTPDLDWLRDASVSLLSLDLSRWTDVHAVDERRVTDLVRAAPPARPGQRMSLADALAIARRAGAGRLVLGDFLKLGARTTLTATAYDVRTGSRIRAARAETAVTDSLTSIFGRLARDVLALAPPPGANLGAVGTSRVDALQEYLAGLRALHGFDIPEAKRRFERALQLDTAFALAHYKLAITSVYDEAAVNAREATQAIGADPATLLAGRTDSTREAHAAAAARLSGPLPPRERTLINGLLAQIKQDHARACDLHGSLVRADSSDVEALYGVGVCTFRDDAVEFALGDSTRPRFRSSWNTTLRVLQRAISLDPGFHLAFNHILEVLTKGSRVGCARRVPALPCERLAPRYSALVRRDADSLLTVPARVTVGAALLGQLTEGERTDTRRQNLERARVAAEEWVEAGPREGRAHRTLGRILLRLGRVNDADREIREAATLLPYDEYSDLPFSRIEIALKLGRGAEVVRLADSLSAAFKTEVTRLGAAALLGPLTGRVARADSAMRRALEAQARGGVLPPPILAYFGQSTRIALALPGDSGAALEQQLLTVIRSQATCGVTCQSLLAPSWMLGLRTPRASWPAFDSTARDPRLAPAAALSARDTARLRLAARAVDSVSREGARLGFPEDGSSLTASDAFLLLGDSAAALAAVRRMLDSTLVTTSLEAPLTSLNAMVFTGTLWPRALLQGAELALAQRSVAEARRWYALFLDLWAKAEPEFQPLVERARRAYRAAGGR